MSNIIAIEGGCGSGKTSLINNIKSIKKSNFITIAEYTNINDFSDDVFDLPYEDQFTLFKKLDISRKKLIMDNKTFFLDRCFLTSIFFYRYQKNLNLFSKIDDLYGLIPTKIFFLDVNINKRIKRCKDKINMPFNHILLSEKFNKKNKDFFIKAAKDIGITIEIIDTTNLSLSEVTKKVIKGY